MNNLVPSIPYITWPQDILGSKIYKREYLIEMSLVNYVWGSLYNMTFKDAIELDKENLRIQKEKINWLYSYLNRLYISNEIDKIYSGREHRAQKRKKAKIKREEIYQVNTVTLEKILKQVPELKHEPAISVQELFDDVIHPLELKKDWVKAERAELKFKIDFAKEMLADMQKGFNKRIFLYNKLKKKIKEVM